MDKFYFKLVAVLTSVFFVFSIIPDLSGAQFYFQPRKRGGGSEVGLRIPFGEGSKPDSESVIDKLKQEETKGTGTAVALVVLGLCIVAAAVVIANRAEDTTEDVIEAAEELLEENEDLLEDLRDESTGLID